MYWLNNNGTKYMSGVCMSCANLVVGLDMMGRFNLTLIWQKKTCCGRSSMLTRISHTRVILWIIIYNNTGRHGFQGSYNGDWCVLVWVYLYQEYHHILLFKTRHGEMGNRNGCRWTFIKYSPQNTHMNIHIVNILRLC